MLASSISPQVRLAVGGVDMPGMSERFAAPFARQDRLRRVLPQWQR